MRLVGAISVKRCAEIRSGPLMALPATAEFGGRGPESKAWSGCRKARAPKSEASVGFRKERLGVDAGKRGLEWFFGRRDLE